LYHQCVRGTRHPKKGGQHLFQGRRQVFRFIKAHKNEYTVEKRCKVLQVSSSSYYYWLKHPIGLREQSSQALLLQIQRVYHESKCRYGSPRISMTLRQTGIVVSRPRVARVMKRANLRSIVRQKCRVQTTDSKHGYAVSENYLQQDFTAERLAQKWVSDLTYIKTGEGWLYLTAVIDLADRKVVGWALSASMRAAATTVAAFKMATRNRPVGAPLLFHSDRGVQYACHEFTRELKKWPVKQSMSRKGNCWDNAVAASFFKTLKPAMVYHHNFQAKAQARLAIFEYIELWYNRQRCHSAIGYRTPCQQEQILLNNKISA
jgi:putative transposase